MHLRSPRAARKTRITVRIDDDLLDSFLKVADAAGGGSAIRHWSTRRIREHVESRALRFEDALRRIVREEIRAAAKKLATVTPS